MKDNVCATRETRALQAAVIPAKAGIHSANLQKCAVHGLDSRFRGNDRRFARDDIPNDTTTQGGPPGSEQRRVSLFTDSAARACAMGRIVALHIALAPPGIGKAEVRSQERSRIMNSEWRIGDAELALRTAPRPSDPCTSSIHNSEFTIQNCPSPSPVFRPTTDNGQLTTDGRPSLDQKNDTPGHGAQSKFCIPNSPFTIHYSLFIILLLTVLLNPES